MSFKKAVKEQTKLRLALCGLAGSGKTYSALAIGTNLIPGGKVALIDTERESASLYADKFEFDTMPLETHSPMSYVEAIGEAEAAGYDVLIIDSLSHAWAGRDGALEQVDKAADRDPRANSFTAWRSVTPKHNALVDKILTAKCHVIATMRTKMEFAQQKNDKSGKTEIVKLGLAAIQREGMEYEFTCVGDIDLTNTLKISKTRLDGVLSPGDIFEKPGASLAKKIYGWLMSGAVPTPRQQPAVPVAAPIDVVEQAAPLAQAVDDVFAKYVADMQATTTQADLDAIATGPGKPSKGTPQHQQASQIYLQQKAAIERLSKANGAAS